MGEEILKIDISELKIVRVICRNCNVITEIGIESLANVFDPAECKSCRHKFFDPNVEDTAFIDLLSAINQLNDAKKKVGMEFVYKIK